MPLLPEPPLPEPLPLPELPLPELPLPELPLPEPPLPELLVPPLDPLLPLVPASPFVPAMEGEEVEVCGFRLLFALPQPARKTGTARATKKQSRRLRIPFMPCQANGEVSREGVLSLSFPAMRVESRKGRLWRARPRPVWFWPDFDGWLSTGGRHTASLKRPMTSLSIEFARQSTVRGKPRRKRWEVHGTTDLVNQGVTQEVTFSAITRRKKSNSPSRLEKYVAARRRG